MVEFAPSTGGLALWVRHEDLDASSDPLIASNDGTTVYYGPAFAKLPLDEQVGLVAHEVLHVALRHPQRRAELERLLGDVDPQLFNICADAIVNSTLSHLTWLALPAGAVFLDQLLERVLGLRESVEKSLLEWDVERLYRVVDDRSPPVPSSKGSEQNKRTSRDGRSMGSGSQQDAAAASESSRADGPRSAQVRALGAEILKDLLPERDPTRPEEEVERSREWGERILRAHAGDGPHSMLRQLVADLPKVRTPWEHLLRTQLNRGLYQKPDLSWSRPSRSYLANHGRAGGISGSPGSRGSPRRRPRPGWWSWSMCRARSTSPCWSAFPRRSRPSPAAWKRS
jgi:hypothetical protein